jgi:methionyl-tRNA formyltransferase
MMKYYMQEEENHIDVLSKMQRTLEEYAADPVNRNRMSSFLSGISLNEFDFVGQIEQFNNHLQQLTTQLNWKQPTQVVHNNASSVSSERNELSENLKQRIAVWNREDVQLYETAGQLRK